MFKTWVSFKKKPVGPFFGIQMKKMKTWRHEEEEEQQQHLEMKKKTRNLSP